MSCMILMKEYVSLTTADMKMGKNIFTVIIAMVAKRMLHWVINNKCFMLHWKINHKSSRACHAYLRDFFEIFSIDRYHRDMKILKILASNSKQFRFDESFTKIKN